MFKVIYENTSDQGKIEVMESDPVRSLFLNGASQGSYNYRTKHVTSPYIWKMADQIPYGASKALLIGCGAFLLPQLRHLDKWTLVDYDMRMAKVANEFFDFQETKEQEFVWSDGLSFLKGTQDRFDCIIIDCFSGFDMPSGLYRFGPRNAKRLLSDKGTFIMNIVDKPNLVNYNYYNSHAIRSFRTSHSQFMEVGINGLRNIICSYSV